MTPEALARESIDRKLAQAGWVVQDMKALNLGAATGVAVREHPTDTGPADYVLFIHRQPVGVIEAKKDSAGENLTATEAQTERYASANLKWRKDSTPLRFLFEATGQIIRFTDGADPAPRSREIFHFFKPETLAAWLAQPDTLRRRLATLPADAQGLAQQLLARALDLAIDTLDALGLEACATILVFAHQGRGRRLALRLEAQALQHPKAEGDGRHQKEQQREVADPAVHEPAAQVDQQAGIQQPGQRGQADAQRIVGASGFRFAHHRVHSSTWRMARKASCGTSTVPICFMRFLPAFCFSSSLRLRVMSPP